MSGCGTSFSIPEDAAIRCESTADCPKGYTCATEVNLCITAEAAAEEGPRLTSYTYNETIGTRDTTFVLTLEVSKELAENPVVTMDVGLRQAPWVIEPSASDPSVLRYVYQYTVDGSESAGTHAVTVQLRDRVGNINAGVSAGTIEIDFTAPGVLVATVSPRFVRHDVEIQLDLLFDDDDVVDDPLVRMSPVGDSSTILTWSRLDAPGYQYVFLADETAHPPGEYEIRVDADDFAGNQMLEVVLGDTVELDFTPPALDSVAINPALARPTQVVRVFADASEIPAGTPTVILRQSGVADIPFEPPQIIGEALTFLHEALAGEDGDYEVWLEGLEDRAGNVLTDTAVTHLGTVTLDSTPPDYADFTGDTTYQATDTMVVTFIVTEELSEDPEVRLDDLPLTRTGGTGLGPYTYELPLTGTGFNGDVPIFLTLTDVAGNREFYNPGAASLDTAAPEIVDVFFSPPTAKNNITALLTVTVDEELIAPPVLTWASPGDPGFTFRTRSGLNYTYELPVTATVTPGSYELASVSLQDVAGNQSNGVPVNEHFAIDIAAPFLTVAPQVNKDAYMHGERIQVTFTANEPLATGYPAVVLATPDAASFTCIDTGGNAFRCDLDVPLDENVQPEGTTGVSIEIADDAGNTAFESIPVTLDFTPPQLLPSPGADLFKLGDTVVYGITFDEPIPSPPTLTVTRDGNDAGNFFGSPISETSTTFTYSHPIGDCSGENPCSLDGLYRVTATGLDVAGNNGGGLSNDEFTIDASPPQFVAPPTSGTAGSPQSVYAAGDIVSVNFTLDADLGGEIPIVRLVTQPNIAMSDCQESPPLVWTCSTPNPLDGTEVVNAVPSGTPVEIHVLATDPAGNQTFASTTVTLDFTPPSLSGASHLLVPDPSNRLFAMGVDAATIGTTIRVTFSVDETLDGDPVVTSSPEDLGWVWVSGTTTVVFEHVVTSTGWTQGSYSLEATLTDLAGNVSVEPLGGVAFELDTVAPATPTVDTTNRIVLTRAPWGTATGSKKLDMRGGAGSVEPNAYVFVYDAADIGGPATAEIGAGRANGSGAFGSPAGQTDIALTGGDRVGVYLVAVDAAGNFSDAGAGAGIQASLVRDVEWIASMGGKVAGQTLTNPHTFSERPHFVPTFRQRGTIEHSDVPATTLGSQDGTSLTSSTRGHYEYLNLSTTTPHRRFGPQLAYDSARAITVLVGGEDNEFSSGCNEGDGDYCAHTWEWNGSAWRQVVLADPEGDGNPTRIYNQAAITYDSRREVVVLVDSDGPDMVTWEYDGNSWARRCTESPCTDNLFGLMYSFAMAFDAKRGVTVLFGGGTNNLNVNFDNTWEWDGVLWRLRDLADPEGDGNPEARRRHCMVYNNDRDVIMLWGGYAGSDGYPTDVWEYDGASWLKRTPTGGPVGREYFGMTYDNNRNRMVVFGGIRSPNCDGSPDFVCEGTWEYNPSNNTWSSELCGGNPCLLNRPTRRYNLAMVYDSARKRSVMFGGDAGSTAFCDAPSTYHHCYTTSEWDGVFWNPRRPIDPEWDGSPVGRSDAAAAHNYYYNRFWLFGGSLSSGNCEGSGDRNCQYMWGYNGGSWIRHTPSGTWPTARTGARMVANDWTAVYMFGGINDPTSGTGDCLEGAGEYCDEIYRWYNSSWTLLSPTGLAPSGRYGHAMAYDQSRDQLLVVGGYGATGYLPNGYLYDVSANTWSWVDICIFPPCPTEPPAFTGAGLAYDWNRDVYVLFGGAGSGYASGSNETWEFDPDTWNWSRVCQSSPCSDNMPGPRWDHLMWYDNRMRRVFIAKGANNDDTWSFDGSTWRLEEPIELSDDGEPERSFGGQVGWDYRRQRAIVFGGASLWGGDELWSYESGSETTPAMTIDVPYLAAGTDGTESIRTITPLWVAAARSTSPGSATLYSGARLYAWREGEWQSLVINTAPIGSPATLTTSLNDPESFWSMFVGPGRSLSFGIRGRQGASGNGAAEVEADYAEVEVHYRLAGDCGNDAAPTAITVAVGTTSYLGDTCICSDDFRPACDGTSTADVVYELTTPSTGSWTLDARLSGFDTVLALRSSALHSPDVACNDDATPPGGGGSRISQALANDTTYYLVVDGAGACGAYQLDVTF